MLIIMPRHTAGRNRRADFQASLWFAFVNRRCDHGQSLLFGAIATLILTITPLCNSALSSWLLAQTYDDYAHHELSSLAFRLSYNYLEDTHMKKPRPTQPERTRLKLSQLKPYPLQPLFYGQTSPEEDKRLLADLRHNGQRDPIIVVPARNKKGHYIILDGHRRDWAAGVLGWDDVQSIIRWDLADVDDATVEAEFLQYNLNRRHVHKLDQARIVLRLYEIEKGRPRGMLRRCDEGEARDRVAKVVGMTGRNLQRYFRALLTPVEVQNAVRNHFLPLQDAEQVEGLSKEKQAEIAEVIANVMAADVDRAAKKKAVKAAVSKYVVTGIGEWKTKGQAKQIFTRSLRGLLMLKHCTERISDATYKELLPSMIEVAGLLSEWIAATKS